MGVGEEPRHIQTIANHIRQHVGDKDWQLLVNETAALKTTPQAPLLAKIFTAIPRKVKSKTNLLSLYLDGAEAPNGMPLVVSDWPWVRMIRVWVLMNITALEEKAYVQLIEQLFRYGEVEELAALYAALPVYHYPEAWRLRCVEGIRSNMGPVRQAIIIHNHYPAAFLDEAAWNQLVLKAFFTEEDIPDIVGLQQRNNRRLAQALVDYAYERHAAKREINPMLWVLVSPFIDTRAYNLMEQTMQESQLPMERKAIVYAFDRSNFGLAAEFLNKHRALTDLLDTADTPWKNWL